MSSSDEHKPETAVNGIDVPAGKQSDAKPADARAARLAAALRQNLQRRKAQARGRKPAKNPAESGKD
jgi:hypothetical protein